MRSVERRFKIIDKKHPDWSSFQCFEMAIAGQGFSKKNLYFWFNKLVEKDDYGKKEKRRHLNDLLFLTIKSEAGIK